MLEYIYICRHGFRSNWVDPTIKTGPTGMNRDPPLAAYGQKQASRLAAFLSDSKYPVAVEAGADPRPVPELVFSSPFYRCIETSLPTYQALKELPGGCGQGILLEHGVQEWYSTVVPDTGLHPRPASPSSLSPLFPPNSIDESYASTYLPSRRGETLRELHDRADCFIEAWTARVEEMGVRCVVVFAHAASVIALGRALTGDKDLEVPAGCASTSLYKRKVPGQTNPTSSQWTTGKSTVDTILDKTGLSSVLKSDTESAPQLNEKSSPLPCGVGEWEPVFLGKADYLENGLERNWSFKDVVVVNGEVIEDNGDRVPHQPEDSIPTGLNDGMEKYLRRGLPKKNDQIKEIAENTVRKAELSRI